MILSSTSLYCPFKDCSAALLEAEEGSCGVEKSTKVKVECPHCEREFCTKCIVAWHGMDCEAFEKLEDNEKANEDVLFRNLAKDKRWVRCPSCKFYVERIDGCSELICRKTAGAVTYFAECGLSLYDDEKNIDECQCNIDKGEFEWLLNT
ncbi:probable E3 ubiquitin-protein ligase RNF144A-A [Chenopodium quinoa]|uniref:probable E3 ubiquitin-protein ligase RNF144A-A n=1 Tax=Chenopodium quinoa TaxID=63459 RepID=UPI000B76D38D|nr:probable E3 ubiquitin-protein ligase RNF144A-A [Chenopodium quinoa]